MSKTITTPEYWQVLMRSGQTPQYIAPTIGWRVGGIISQIFPETWSRMACKPDSVAVEDESPTPMAIHLEPALLRAL